MENRFSEVDYYTKIDSKFDKSIQYIILYVDYNIVKI